MTTRFRRECVQGRVRRRVEARANGFGLAEVLAKNGGAFLRADFAELDLVAASPPAERRLTRRTSIPNPAHLAVGRNQPALAVLNQDDRRGVCSAASSATHTKKVGMSPSDTEAKQALHEYVDQARGTKPIRHPSIIARRTPAPLNPSSASGDVPELSRIRSCRPPPQPPRYAHSLIRPSLPLGYGPCEGDEAR